MSNHTPTPESENTTGFIRAIAWTAWNAAANAFRAYPNNKHTFTDHWANSTESYRSYHSGYYHMEKCANALTGIPDPEKWVEDIKAENTMLKAEIDKLREQRSKDGLAGQAQLDEDGNLISTLKAENERLKTEPTFSHSDMMDIAGWMAAADNKRPIPELKEEAIEYIKRRWPNKVI